MIGGIRRFDFITLTAQNPKLNVYSFVQCYEVCNIFSKCALTFCLITNIILANDGLKVA